MLQNTATHCNTLQHTATAKWAMHLMRSWVNIARPQNWFAIKERVCASVRVCVCAWLCVEERVDCVKRVSRASALCLVNQQSERPVCRRLFFSDITRHFLACKCLPEILSQKNPFCIVFYHYSKQESAQKLFCCLYTPPQRLPSLCVRNTHERCTVTRSR